ncbi:hypothetical protein M0812_07309 [Anaeramoeba flamelloides]|uniref:Protein GPR107 n=1 Tax=Anaeramoeba flamelloides TaxID=1746091 RepID=A0AAV8A2W3_9EUKA|nr:hypothetical protein M0812_07309 [Anaeramoeba flamelloides]
MKQKIQITFFVLFLIILSQGACRKQELQIENDERSSFLVETFGFLKGGYFEMKVNELTVSPESKTKENELTDQLFLLESQGEINLDTDIFDCLVKEEKDQPGLHIVRNTASNWKKGFTYRQKITKEGQYFLYYSQCDSKSTQTNFDIRVTMKNLDTYLSAGEIPLPKLYSFFFLMYFCLLLTWIIVMKRKGNGTKKVLKIHYVMAVLLISKTLSIMCKSIEYHYLSTRGDPKGANIPYYIFHLFKGILLFMVILLLGTGWSFMKNTLNEKHKNLIMIIIPLQILANIGIVVTDEMMRGAKGWVQWWDLLKFFDLVCMLCILYPIAWTIKNLRTAASVDGKVAKNLERLKVFKEFYMVTFVYIYLTRLIIVLFQGVLPFKLTWIADLFSETATILLYLYVGYRFRPAQENIYLKLVDENESDEDIEVIPLENFELEFDTIKRVVRYEETQSSDDFFDDDPDNNENDNEQKDDEDDDSDDNNINKNENNN